MKLKSLRLKNFARFSDFEIEFEGQITRLVGMNGSGKTTVGLTAIWAGFKGIAERSGTGQLIGERFRFIGNNGKSADIEITLIDEVEDTDILIKRHITKSSNQITFEAPDNYPIDDAWLDNLLNISFLSAKHFTSLSSKDQALALGIETSEYDNKITELKSDASEIRRDIKAMGDIIEMPKVVAVDVQDLIKKRDTIDEFNRGQEGRAEDLKDAMDIGVKLADQLEVLLDAVEKQKAAIDACKTDIKKFGTVKPPKDRSGIDTQIVSVNSTNEKAAAYNQYLIDSKKHRQKSKELDNNIQKQDKVVANRLKYIKSFDLGFDGLVVDEKGGLILKDRPIKEPYYSRSELEIIVAYLYASVDPALKVRFIDDFECLDDENQKALTDKLLADGFQIITAEVGSTVKDNNSVLLRECKIADSKQKQKIGI